MDENLELLYQHLVGMPNPKLWPIETKNSPMLGHGFYSFIQGLRLGFSLGRLLTRN